MSNTTTSEPKPLTAARLRGATPSHRGVKCGVGSIIRLLDPEEADALKAMFRSKAWSGAQITEALAQAGYRDEYGYPTRSAAVNRHRRKACMCGRDLR